jgi:hypothetical protein
LTSLRAHASKNAVAVSNGPPIPGKGPHSNPPSLFRTIAVPAYRLAPLLSRSLYIVGPVDFLTTPQNWCDCPEQRATIRSAGIGPLCIMRVIVSLSHLNLTLSAHASKKAIASRLSLCDKGPFPLDHDDFLHSNIIVDENTFIALICDGKFSIMATIRSAGIGPLCIMRVIVSLSKR